MKIINAQSIRETVAELCVKANLDLRQDVKKALISAGCKEHKRLSKKMIKLIAENAKIASAERIAICQDTGMPVVFVELGQDVHIKGDIKKAINKGVESGYKRASLRNSIINDPISRKNTSRFSPAVIHFDLNNTDKCKITVLPKGFGSENKSQVKMLNPTASLEEIKAFIVEAVKEAGPDACPPFIVGVGIGGTQDKACFLAKKALLRPVSKHNKNNSLKKIEAELLKDINKLKIGVMGLGGSITAIAVHIQTYPTHIAGLPVAVNISCHALRSASRVI